MKTSKTINVSDCCEGETYFCPPSLGEEGFFVCQTCLKGCTTHFKEIQTHEEIEKGVFRPIKKDFPGQSET